MANKKTFKDAEGKQILFFQVPLEFGSYLSTLRDTSITLYDYFMKQVYYTGSLRIRVSLDTLVYEVGLNKETIRVAIVDLATEGWIEDIIPQHNQSNIYVVNIVRHVNDALLIKLANQKAARSIARKKSVSKQDRKDNGEFIRKTPVTEKSDIPSNGKTG